MAPRLCEQMTYQTTTTPPSSTPLAQVNRGRLSPSPSPMALTWPSTSAAVRRTGPLQLLRRPLRAQRTRAFLFPFFLLGLCASPLLCGGELPLELCLEALRVFGCFPLRGCGSACCVGRAIPRERGRGKMVEEEAREEEGFRRSMRGCFGVTCLGTRRL